MTKKARESSHNAEQRGYDQELAQNPPIVIWETEPNSGGIRRAVHIRETLPDRPGRAPRPPCKCDLYGSPKRRQGPHHDDDCARSKPW